MSDLLLLDVETALRNLLECFEPTSPSTIMVQTEWGLEGYLVSEECEEAISQAERVLAELDNEQANEE